MAITEATVSLSPDTVARIREELRARGFDGWLLYNFLGCNPVASGLLGLPALTRRYFAWIPAEGAPIAVTHRIEQQPWETWPGEKVEYASWRELEERLRTLLGSGPTAAMEYAEGDAVPYVDRVPAGVLELVRAAGAKVVSSGDLVSAFYSRWSAEGEASHRRAAQVVRDAAHAGFKRVAGAVRAGEEITEWSLRLWIQEELRRGGVAVEGDAIVAVNGHAANPHYAPSAEKHAAIRHGDLLLIDLWGKETEDSVYADQTWMGYVGEAVPERLAEIFRAVTDARDAAVDLVMRRFAAGEPVRGWEVDDASRGVIEERGWGKYFIHRTGHSIDRELHGSGPNIDNLETRDTRTLIPGIGFSIEPGIYLTGDVGFRSEVDVFIGAGGPEVTTPSPQREVYPLLRDDPFSA
jgi:Xaa-Pro dipeptidase